MMVSRSMLSHCCPPTNDGAKDQVLTSSTAQGPAIQAALEEMTGQHTVPNIFINKRHIGGNSDLMRRRAELPKLLKDAGALKGPATAVPGKGRMPGQ